MSLFTAPAACPVCGAGRCACKPAHDDGVTIIDYPARSSTMAPLHTYRTHTGDYRLDEAGAKARGLIPDGDGLPRRVRRRLAIEARLSPAQLEDVAGGYAELDDGERRGFLESIALTNPRDLRARFAAAFKAADEELDADDLTTAVEPDGSPAAILRGRVGEVVDTVDAVEDDDERRQLAGRLLEAEVAGQGRKSLVAELERRATAEEV